MIGRDDRVKQRIRSLVRRLPLAPGSPGGGAVGSVRILSLCDAGIRHATDFITRWVIPMGDYLSARYDAETVTDLFHPLRPDLKLPYVVPTHTQRLADDMRKANRTAVVHPGNMCREAKHPFEPEAGPQHLPDRRRHRVGQGGAAVLAVDHRW